MLYFLIVPIHGWLVEHPKIKIKSLIILNYGVNVQYAYNVKCDKFWEYYIQKVLNMMYFMWMLNNIHICRSPYPWFFNTLHIKLILHDALDIWKNDLNLIEPMQLSNQVLHYWRRVEANGLGSSNIIWIKNLIVKANMAKIFKKKLCGQIANYRT